MLKQNTRGPSRPLTPWVGVDTTSVFFSNGEDTVLQRLGEGNFMAGTSQIFPRTWCISRWIFHNWWSFRGCSILNKWLGYLIGELAVQYIYKVNAAFNLTALPPTTTAVFTPGFPLGANVVWAGPIQMGLEEHGTRASPNNHDKGAFPNWVLPSVVYT